MLLVELNSKRGLTNWAGIAAVIKQTKGEEVGHENRQTLGLLTLKPFLSQLSQQETQIRQKVDRQGSKGHECWICEEFLVSGRNLFTFGIIFRGDCFTLLFAYVSIHNYRPVVFLETTKQDGKKANDSQGNASWGGRFCCVLNLTKGFGLEKGGRTIIYGCVCIFTSLLLHPWGNVVRFILWGSGTRLNIFSLKSQCV